VEASGVRPSVCLSRQAALPQHGRRRPISIDSCFPSPGCSQRQRCDPRRIVADLLSTELVLGLELRVRLGLGSGTGGRQNVRAIVISGRRRLNVPGGQMSCILRSHVAVFRSVNTFCNFRRPPRVHCTLISRGPLTKPTHVTSR